MNVLREKLEQTEQELRKLASPIHTQRIGVRNRCNWRLKL
jgi:hypothetical protein